MTAIGINVLEVGRHRKLLLGGLGILFAQVPVQRELIAESGDHFPYVEFPFLTEVAAVKRLLHRPGVGRATSSPTASAHVVVVLGFLKLEVQVEAFLLRVVKEDAPLIELGD